MPVVKYEDMKFGPIIMDGVQGAAKFDAIGPEQGWDDHTMRLFTLEPKGFTPHHQHDWEHINYVAKGRLSLTIGDAIHELKTGDFALVPANTMHQFRNPHEDPAEFICIVPNRGAY